MFINSPERAPINGPINIPRGPIKTPNNNPIDAPIIPFFVPPSFFKPITGIIRSNIKTEIAIKNVAEIKEKLKLTNEVKFKKSSPTQLVIGPGIIGIKLPINPIIHNISQITKKNTSIN